jgi:hypothetical protein
LTEDFWVGEEGVLTGIRAWVDNLSWPEFDWAMPEVFTEISEWIENIEWPSFNWETPPVFTEISQWIEGLQWPEMPDWETPGVFDTISEWTEDIEWPEAPDWEMPDVFGTISGWTEDIEWPSFDWEMPDVFGTISGWIENIEWPSFDLEIPDVFGMIENFEFPDVQAWLEGLDWAQLGRGFVSVVLLPMDGLVAAINALFDSIVFTKTIPNPFGDDWVVGMDLSSWDIPTPSDTVIDLIGLAEGGIVTGPTMALIGEAGPEAVIPLDKAGGGGMGGTYNMTFNLSGMTDRTDKRQFAQEISRLIQQEMRRTVGAGTTRGRY